MGENISVSSENSHVLEEKRTLNISQQEYSMSARYHQSEIDQNAIVVKNAINMIWIGIGLLGIGMIMSAFMRESLIPLIPGAFVDIFSGTMIFLINKSSESKQKYFDNLTVVEHEERIIELINKSDDNEFKQAMITKIVDRHCGK